jgi:hypothetical protein
VYFNILRQSHFIKKRAPLIENALEGNIFTVRAPMPLSRAAKTMVFVAWDKFNPLGSHDRAFVGQVAHHSIHSNRPTAPSKGV